MHIVRARGNTARTRLHPLRVCISVALYLKGGSVQTSANKTGLGYSTLFDMLGRLGVRRTKAEAERARRVREGKASLVARRRLIEKEYTPAEALRKREEIASRFGVSVKTIDRDRKAIGYRYSDQNARIVLEHGSIAEYRRMQRRAALLRKRGEEVKDVAETLGVCPDSVRNMIERYEARRGQSDE